MALTSNGKLLHKQEIAISVVTGKTMNNQENPFQQNMDYIDERTKSIINGYIQNAKKLLNPEFFKNIPLEINQITLFFVDDHFMIHRGSYQWKINGSRKMEILLHTQPDSCYYSNSFEMCNKLRWRARLFLNGDSTQNIAAGHVVLMIDLSSLPPKWSSVLIQQTLICHEQNTVYHAITRYRSDRMS